MKAIKTGLVSILLRKCGHFHMGIYGRVIVKIDHSSAFHVSSRQTVE